MHALGSCLFDNVSFLSYFLTLTPSMNDFAELPATRLVNLIGMPVFILSEFIILYIYI